MLTSARLTLKHHRFELASVVAAAVLLGAAGLWLNAQLLAIAVPAGCFDAWLGSGGSPGSECAGPVTAFNELLYGNMSWFDPAMAVLPFAVGTLTGVPLVARELESRTAQTAWSLSPSRSRWLTRQIWPTVLLVGAAVVFAAVAASMFQATRATGFPTPTFGDLGFHGPLVVARALLAFGVGLLAGAAIGRALPAVIVTAVACVVLLLFVAMGTRDAWLRAQPQELISQADMQAGKAALALKDLWRAPDGTVLTDDEAFAVAPRGAEDPYIWLLDAGYEPVYMGITKETAAKWEGIEIVGTLALGVILVGAAYPVVYRRRPA